MVEVLAVMETMVMKVLVMVVVRSQWHGGGGGENNLDS